MRGKLSPKWMVQYALLRAGYTVRRLSSEERQAFLELQRPEGADEDIAGLDLAHLDDLRRRYDALDIPAAVHSVWAHRRASRTSVSRGLAGFDLTRFRASSSYVWNYYGTESETARLKYFIFQQAVKAADAAGLLGRLTEDGAFGCPTFEFDETGTISRDLLDSVAEINFLQRHLDVLGRADVHVLDIGAGYGRMAHRLLEANPRLTGYTCVDAIPESTFLSEFYLNHRGLADRSNVVPLDEVETRVTGPFDIALNIHSFSECTYAAVEWWLRLVRRLEIPRLMIVPNPDPRFRTDEDRFVSSEPDGSKRNFLPLLTELDYEIVDRQPLVDPGAAALLGVDDVMFLFELRS